MLAVIRIKGTVGIRNEIKETLRMLGLKKKNTLVIVPRSDSIVGMLKKVENVVTWGEVSDSLASELKNKKTRLKPPKKGFRSLKLRYPKGDLGYRGKEIDNLIKRMM